ncbi:MAG TPA: glycerol-3-phosphate 1-O-acyltransferase PlsY [Coriobacteriia bacterium]|nr:glycerol-3-phosphate 1-O-acyltransferase PlsY [Coriobacteriia bacterium]
MLASQLGFWSLVALVLVGAYLLGAIPWSLVVGKRFYGIDPREHGSGNLGATNVFRVLGARAGGATLVLDAGKGALAVGLAKLLVSSQAFGVTAADWVAVGAMAASVLGHAYSPYIGFKGGKGVATSAGALAVMTPLGLVIELAVFAAVIATSRIVSLGSVVVAITYPILVLMMYPDSLPTIVTVFALAALVLWRHRTNIVRIVRGEENKLSFSRRGAARSDEAESSDKEQ